ncbi:MAG: ABC transporter ATP-binding protein [Alphaproteobacteria bacterium]|nr:ABC transporter ATP-binding protein [Alphaproteobacteria bacterium]
MTQTQSTASAAAPPAKLTRLRLDQLSVSLTTEAGMIPVVQSLSLSIAAGETLALVGESGSGKSVTSLAVMGLLDRHAQPEVQGQAWFTRGNGETVDLLSLDRARRRQLCGNELAMIFQEPMTSLNPVLSIGEQIAESLCTHRGIDHRAALARALEMLEMVEVPAAKQRLHHYPHQLSGGLRQRVMIAMAMVCNPSLLIADEPTTALDATVQAQILALMGRLQRETGMAILFVTHNLGVVAHYADRVAVIYAGRIVESAGVEEFFDAPLHPYSRGLLACLPGVARLKSHGESRPRLTTIPGLAARAGDSVQGCSFAPRCSHRQSDCEASTPVLTLVDAPATKTARSLSCFHSPGKVGL